METFWENVASAAQRCCYIILSANKMRTYKETCCLLGNYKLSRLTYRSKKHLIDRYTYTTKAYYQRSISRKGFRTTKLNSKFYESLKELPILLRQKRKRFYGVLYVLCVLPRGTCLLLCAEMETWMIGWWTLQQQRGTGCWDWGFSIFMNTILPNFLIIHRVVLFFIILQYTASSWRKGITE